MDLKSLQVFLTVHSNLSFTATANELHMSVSAVSRAILRLEENLNCRLFDRDRRGMTITNAGRELQLVAERMIADWRDLQHMLGDAGTLRGDLSIYCSVTATHQLLSPLLAAYRDAHPGVEVRLQTGDQADGLSRVREGATDVAVIARPQELHDTLEFLPLAESPLSLCLPAMDCSITASLRGKRGSAFWSELHLQPWILPERGVSREIIERWLFQSGNANPDVYARVAGHEAIAAMISLGLGIGVLPELVVAASGVETGLKLRPVPDLPSLSIGLCIRGARLSDPVVSSLWTVAGQS